MKTERKKIEKIAFFITIAVIFAAVLVVVLFLINRNKMNENNINLVDNQYIRKELKECSYNIFHIELDYKSYEKSINFHDYPSKYVCIEIGKNYEKTYKNAVNSIILKNVKDASVEQIEKSMTEYKEKAYQFLKCDSNVIKHEFDRNKVGLDEIDKNTTTYEGLKEDKIVHYIMAIYERENYEISFYVQNNNLIGEISYYLPNTYTPDIDDVDNEKIPEKEGAVG